MRALSAPQQAALDDSATQLVTLWRLTLTDGTVLRLTDCDTAIQADGFTWQPSGSTERSSVRLGTGLQAGNVDVSGIISAGVITEDDLRAGRYDHAKLHIAIGFANAALPSIPLVAGRFGEISLDNSQYRVEVNDLGQALQASIGESTSAACRATFGDARCQASLATWRQTYTLASVPDARTLVLTAPITLPGGTYAQGLVELMSGPASGYRMEVKSWDAGARTLGLYLPLPVLPVAGNSVRVTAGCDKALATCKLVFANTVNFQGEPHVPGLDALAAPDVA
jgi:uncharacterized phage protein (TIGR02218 family)